MNFFDLEPMGCPRDAVYYFNILVVNIMFSPSAGFEYEEYWDLQHILDPRPYVVHLYTEDEEEIFENGDIFEVEYFPHSVVETSQSLGVCFYDMLDEDYCEDEDDWGEFYEDFWRL